MWLLDCRLNGMHSTCVQGYHLLRATGRKSIDLYQKSCDRTSWVSLTEGEGQTSDANGARMWWKLTSHSCDSTSKCQVGLSGLDGMHRQAAEVEELVTLVSENKRINSRSCFLHINSLLSVEASNYHTVNTYIYNTYNTLLCLNVHLIQLLTEIT